MFESFQNSLIKIMESMELFNKLANKKSSDFGAYVQFCQTRRKSTHFHKRRRNAA